MADGARQVFVNCPFDSQYQPLFRAIVFTILRAGFRARCALETDDASETRFAKIQSIIEGCRYGIHDLSRTGSDGDPPLPRFNMPLELGLFLGAKRYGDPSQKRKRALILDVEQFRYQRFISDIAGQDIHAHGGEVGRTIETVAGWLRTQSRSSRIPGGRHIAQEFEQFLTLLPEILNARGLHAQEITFGDFSGIATSYIATLS